MSLTGFLKCKEIRDRFREEFRKPKFNMDRKLLAPPLTKHWPVVGTAFDYLMRFYLKRLNPKAIERRWIAEESLNVLFILKGGFALDEETTDVVMFNKIERILSEGHDRYQAYLKMGKITKPLLTSAILLANLDIIYRTDCLEYAELDVVDDADIRDLRKQLEIINPKIFKARKICLLNPTFGEASSLVGGADADLVVDDTLIDIKTTKKLQLTRDYFNQLIGYYCLNRIGGMDGVEGKHEIRRLGIYFSRYGYLHLIEVKEYIDERKFASFLEWFKMRADA